MNITDNSPITIEGLAARVPQLMALDSIHEFWQVGVAINLTEILKHQPENTWVNQINRFLTMSFDQFNTVLPSTEDDVLSLADMTLEWLRNPEEFKEFKRTREVRFEIIDQMHSIHGF